MTARFITLCLFLSAIAACKKNSDSSTKSTNLDDLFTRFETPEILHRVKRIFFDAEDETEDDERTYTYYDSGKVETMTYKEGKDLTFVNFTKYEYNDRNLQTSYREYEDEAKTILSQELVVEYHANGGRKSSVHKQYTATEADDFPEVPTGLVDRAKGERKITERTTSYDDTGRRTHVKSEEYSENSPEDRTLRLEETCTYDDLGTQTCETKIEGEKEKVIVFNKVNGTLIQTSFDEAHPDGQVTHTTQYHKDLPQLVTSGTRKDLGVDSESTETCEVDVKEKVSLCRGDVKKGDGKISRSFEKSLKFEVFNVLHNGKTEKYAYEFLQTEVAKNYLDNDKVSSSAEWFIEYNDHNLVKFREYKLQDFTKDEENPEVKTQTLTVDYDLDGTRPIKHTRAGGSRAGIVTYHYN